MAELKALLENRKEHVQYLQDVLLEPVMEEFLEMYQSVRAKSKILQEFQTELGKIPEWNHVLIGNAYERVKKRSGCKFLPDLLRAIFTTSVKCHLMTHGKLDALNTIRFRVPTTEKFIHRLLISCAQHIWKQPYLFYHAVRSIEQQYNRGKVEEIIKKQVEVTIRQCLPIEQLVGLIQDNMEEGDSTSSSSASEDTQSEEESEESSSESESEDEEPVSDVEIERIVVEDDEYESDPTDTEDEAEDIVEMQNDVIESGHEADNEDDIVIDSEDSDKPDKEMETSAEEMKLDLEDVATFENKKDDISNDDRESLEDVDGSDMFEDANKMSINEVNKENEEMNINNEIVNDEQLDVVVMEPVDHDVHHFDELVKALETEPDVLISDASPQRKSIEINTSSSSDESDDPIETFTTEDRKVIPLKNMLINQRKFHRPKMASKSKRADRVPDAFY